MFITFINVLSNIVHKFVICVTTPEISSFIHFVEFGYFNTSVIYKLVIVLYYLFYEIFE